jgi:hypothetical protein
MGGWTFWECDQAMVYLGSGQLRWHYLLDYAKYGSERRLTHLVDPDVELCWLRPLEHRDEFFNSVKIMSLHLLIGPDSSGPILLIAFDLDTHNLGSQRDLTPIAYKSSSNSTKPEYFQ